MSRPGERLSPLPPLCCRQHRLFLVLVQIVWAFVVVVTLFISLCFWVFSFMVLEYPCNRLRLEVSELCVSYVVIYSDYFDSRWNLGKIPIRFRPRGWHLVTCEIPGVSC